ncbi:hypothetical protein K443DRAFT_682969 [Laccaria amethystina LaAM-08-1]|uniref:SAM domain-containing protein n=1 Tax=Laccaria amethystina LaAM-08-1 TaxID=1095629 RepID=A0A0C9X2U8_9AGAR|nr:hypothetical protein K443DRAFT_682969 [Laccaria amethystina LaAM-08-1]
MPEYAPALYDLFSKPKDQGSFRARERTAVVEKGNMYINGLWKGHNRTGAVAFSPKSYTSPAAPLIKSAPAVRSITFAAKSFLDLDREPEFTLPRLKQLTAPFPNPGDRDDEDLGGLGSGGENDRVAGDRQMIERLEQDADGDVANSLDVDTETDEGGSEMSDTKHASDVNDAHDWHKSARRKLAEKTRRAAQKLEGLSRPYPRKDADIPRKDEEVEGGQAVRRVVFPKKHESELQSLTMASSPVLQLAPLSNLLFQEATFMEEKIPSPASTSVTLPHARLFGLEKQKGTTPTAAVEDKTEGGKNEKNPSEWTVDEVVEWLKGKGIDQNICDKFVAHEITGDVLLKLDVDLLKTEVGVVGFGKLMCIANAITDLRWPASRVYSGHPKGRPSLFSSGEASKEKVILQPKRDEDVNRGRGEAVSLQNMHRHPFPSGLSRDSTTHTGDSSKLSQGTFTPASSPPSHGDKLGAGDKLTFFALPFSGKRRKPPPGVCEDEIQAERSLTFSLPKGGNPSPTHLQPSKHSDSAFKTPQMSSEGLESPERTLINGKSSIVVQQGRPILTQIGEPDHIGWMYKKRDGGNSWKPHHFVLKGQHLFWLKSDSNMETHLEGFVAIVGYKVTMDETLYPGRYGFRIDRDQGKTHFFTSDSVSIIWEWVKAIMKATIARDHTKPVISPCTIPTIPLAIAQAMDPAPRPPSPATMRALQRENHDQLSNHDAHVLSVVFPDIRNDRTHSTTDKGTGTPPSLPQNSAFLKPKEERSASSLRSALNPSDSRLVEWVNSHLPPSLQVDDPTTSFFGGLALLRLAESIGGIPCSPPVPDSAFPVDPTDDNLDGLFRLFDLLLDNGVHTGSVCINDIRQGKRGKILQLLKALKSWEDRRGVLAWAMNGTSHHRGGGAFSVPTGMWAGI